MDAPFRKPLPKTKKPFSAQWFRYAVAVLAGIAIGAAGFYLHVAFIKWVCNCQ